MNRILPVAWMVCGLAVCPMELTFAGRVLVDHRSVALFGQIPEEYLAAARTLGHSAAIHEGVAYVGGFDRKLHAIDAKTGNRLWAVDEAEAGYRTSPLVADEKVCLGNRDGWFYAVNVFRNFLYLTPELAGYLRANALDKVKAGLEEIERVAPYWFVTHYEGCLQESNIQNLHDYNPVFQAHAWILRETRAQLDCYLDVPAFAVGDLNYLQQLVSLLEAQH